MALFQPTNITPSKFGGLGDGTVDASQNLTVSWQVNGNSAMTAFQITIYTNDTQSTQVYTTGQITNAAPFYGVDYLGNVQFFSYIIPAATLSSAGITNGNEYKLIIQQWWSATESTTQTSASVFITRAAPTVTLASFLPSITSRSATFAATYSQAQNDAIMWARWQIAVGADGEDIIYDSNNIYGTAELKTEYDGFFTGNTYSVRLTVQTVNGVQATTGWQNFTVTYAEAELGGFVEAKCIRGVGGVFLQWPGISYIQGAPNGSYGIDENGITLAESASVVWNEVTGAPMNSGTPWTFIWRGDTSDYPRTPFILETESGTLTFNLNSNGFNLALGGTPLFTQDLLNMAPRQWLVFVSQDSVTVKTVGTSGALYPSPDLYPSTTLYPESGTLDPTIYSVFTGNYPTITGGVTSVTLAGTQVTQYIDLEKTQYTQSEINSSILTPDFKPTANFAGTTYLYTDFSNGLAAGNITSLGEELEGFAIYRQRAGEGIIRHVADLPLTQVQMIDYGVASQGTYTYYMYAIGESSYATSALVSGAVTPIFWSWDLLSCITDSDGRYHVDAEFKFGKNLTSGALTNNNVPTILENFTPYPLIQPKLTNFKSGTLTSLIGDVNVGVYSDTIALREAIAALSTSSNVMFLKSRKGDIWQIRPSDAISFATMDNTVEQAQTVTLSWTEIGNAENASIILTPSDEMWAAKTRGTG